MIPTTFLYTYTEDQHLKSQSDSLIDKDDRDERCRKKGQLDTDKTGSDYYMGNISEEIVAHAFKSWYGEKNACRINFGDRLLESKAQKETGIRFGGHFPDMRFITVEGSKYGFVKSCKSYYNPISWVFEKKQVDDLRVYYDSHKLDDFYFIGTTVDVDKRQCRIKVIQKMNWLFEYNLFGEMKLEKYRNIKRAVYEKAFLGHEITDLPDIVNF